MEPQDPSHRIAQLWQLEIDHVTKTCLTHFGGLTPEQLNWTPHTHTWSIAQNLAHLIRLNESYFPTFNRLKAGNYTPPFWAKVPLLPERLGKLLLKTVQPTSKKKIKTAPLWEPDPAQNTLKILATFQQHQKQLKAHLLPMAPLLSRRVVICSPAHKHIAYPLETAICILITHEKRHVQKAKELLAQLRTLKT